MRWPPAGRVGAEIGPDAPLGVRGPPDGAARHDVIGRFGAAYSRRGRSQQHARAAVADAVDDGLKLTT